MVAITANKLESNDGNLMNYSSLLVTIMADELLKES